MREKKNYLNKWDREGTVSRPGLCECLRGGVWAMESRALTSFLCKIRFKELISNWLYPAVWPWMCFTDDGYRFLCFYFPSLTDEMLNQTHKQKQWLNQQRLLWIPDFWVTSFYFGQNPILSRNFLSDSSFIEVTFIPWVLPHVLSLTALMTSFSISVSSWGSIFMVSLHQLLIKFPLGNGNIYIINIDIIYTHI